MATYTPDGHNKHENEKKMMKIFSFTWKADAQDHPIPDTEM